MDARTRFRHVMQYQPVDRVPWLEEGLRDIEARGVITGDATAS